MRDKNKDWAWIPYYRGRYKVTRDGRVISVARTLHNDRQLPERVLKPRLTKGRAVVNLYHGKKHSYPPLCKLVFNAFSNEKLTFGEYAAPKDGNPFNAAFENLQRRSNNWNNAKLNQKKADRIRDKYVPWHITRKELAQKFDVSVGTIKAVLEYSIWI